MNKVLKGLVAVAATAAMAVAGFAGASTAMADDPTGGIQVDSNDTHTYSVYQILTGTYGANGALGNASRLVPILRMLMLQAIRERT